MASSFSCLLAGALLLVLVHQQAARDTFDLDKEVEKFVEELNARDTNKTLIWWDVHGDHDEIKKARNVHLPVTAAAGPVVYGPTKSSVMRPNVVYSHWVDNGQASSHQTYTVARTTEHTKTATWHVEGGFSYSGSLSVSAGLFAVNIETTHTITLDLKGGYSKQVSDKETYSVNHVVTVPPMKSVKIQWIITDAVQEVPWTSTVSLTGEIGIKWTEKYRGVLFFYYSLGELGDSRLKYVGNETYEYTAKGTFTGVQGHESRLRITEQDFQPYGARSSAVRTYSIPLRLTPHTPAANNA